jgi:hypothetical protein
MQPYVCVGLSVVRCPRTSYGFLDHGDRESTVKQRSTEPDDSKPGRWGHRWGPRRLSRRMTAAIAIGLALLALTMSLVRPSPTEVEAAGVPPGLQPGVQRWMKERERPQIELNDALVPVVKKQIRTGTPTVRCRRLINAVRALRVRPAAPDVAVDQLTRVGLPKFEAAATACMARDIPTAERLVAEGLAERTAVQETLDETLEGE